jgi:hypothetical protein
VARVPTNEIIDLLEFLHVRQLCFRYFSDNNLNILCSILLQHACACKGYLNQSLQNRIDIMMERTLWFARKEVFFAVAWYPESIPHLPRTANHLVDMLDDKTIGGWLLSDWLLNRVQLPFLLNSVSVKDMNKHPQY